MMTDYLKDKPKLAEWLGDKNNEGYMVADLEALTNILPYLAVAKADSSDDEYHPDTGRWGGRVRLRQG